MVVIGTASTTPAQNAELVLPVTNMAEENGTYVNRDGRVQRYPQAKAVARHGAAGLVDGRRSARRGPGPGGRGARPPRRRSRSLGDGGRPSAAHRTRSRLTGRGRQARRGRAR